MTTTTTKNNVEVKVENEPTEACEPRLRDALKATRPAKFVARHAKGVVAGIAGAGAAVAAAAIAVKAAREGGYTELSDIADTVGDAVPIPGDE